MLGGSSVRPNAAWPAADNGTSAGLGVGVVAAGVVAAVVGEDLGFDFTYVNCFCTALLSAISIALERPTRSAGVGVSFSMKNVKALAMPFISPVSTVNDSSKDVTLAS
jgi:hypothetical protein